MKHICFLIFILGWLLAGSVRLTPAARAAPYVTYELVKSFSGPGSGGSAGIYDLSSSIGQAGAGEVHQSLQARSTSLCIFKQVCNTIQTGNSEQLDIIS